MNLTKLLTSTALTLALTACASLPFTDNEVISSVDIKNQWQSSDGQATSVENGWLDSLGNYRVK